MPGPCAFSECTNGLCGLSYAPFQTVIPDPVGNCQRLICDGMGNVIQENANDVPNDGNQCTVDFCAGGVPGHAPAPLGSPCSGPSASICDGAGNCTPAPPTVASVAPFDNGMPPASVLANASIVLTFSAAMDPSTLFAQSAPGPCSGSLQVSPNDFTSCVGLSSVAPSLSAGNTIATWVQRSLLVNRLYKVRVTTAARSAVGAPLATPYTSSTGFNTVAPPGGAVNESNSPLEADYCTIQFPPSITGSGGSTSPPVFGQIYEAGLTEAPGQNFNIIAQLGFGAANFNPQYQPWTWVSATYNVQAGNNDEYQATFTLPNPGTYRYVYRFSRDGGVTWTYCDNNVPPDFGAGSNAGLTFDLENMGVLTVTP